jgi:hypothetical protein
MDLVAGQGFILGTPSGQQADFALSEGLVNGVLEGNLTYDDVASNEHVKSTAVTSYVVTGPTSRLIQGDATVDGVGGFTYTLDLITIGPNSFFSIAVSDGYHAAGILGPGGTLTLDVVTCEGPIDAGTDSGEPVGCRPMDLVAGQGFILGTPSGQQADFALSEGLVNGVLEGSFTYDDVASNEHVRSTAVTSYVVTGPTSRQIQGDATVNGVSGFTYTLDLIAIGPNRVFSIAVSDGYHAAGILGPGGTLTLDVVTCEGPIDAGTDSGEPVGCRPMDLAVGQGFILGTPSGQQADFALSEGLVNGVLEGSFTYDDVASNEHVKSTAVTSYVVTGPTSRQIQGDATVNGVSGFTYTLNLIANGAGSFFSITVSNGYAAAGILRPGGTLTLDVVTCP